MSILSSRHLPLFALLLILAASAGLYLPWIDNPLVFDDPNLLKSPALGDYAIMPFSLSPRQFPYFTLGMEQVLSNGNLHVSRYVALILHGLNGFLLFALARRLLNTITEPNKAALLALAAGLLFVVHPVSVYAAGYLIQRTILFATFFLLLSAIQFDKALTEGSWHRAVFAGLCYGMAAMSKEHAMPGFLVVAALIFLRDSTAQRTCRRPLLAFLAVSAPIAAWIALIKLGYVAVAYEPDVGEIIGSSGFPDAGSRLGNWALSAALQCGFFFRYVAFWLWPDPTGISIDIRPDFAAITHGPWLFLAPASLFVMAGCAIYGFTSRRISPSLRLVAFGLFWMLVLFSIELATIRFQEPIVLYRSYLWAPGLLLAAVVLSIKAKPHVAAPVLLLLVAALVFLSQQRLATFASELSLWEEAANKIPNLSTPGAIRIFYNRGIFRLRSGDHDGAEQDFEWVIQTDPKVVQGYLGRAALRVTRQEWQGAAEDLRIAIHLRPDAAILHYRLGLVLKKLHRHQESETEMSEAQSLGMTSLIEPSPNKNPAAQ
ncbi:hypothetical protein DLREEDagrD3_04900 [Denitratisoma sp. agr-D3]